MRKITRMDGDINSEGRGRALYDGGLLADLKLIERLKDNGIAAEKVARAALHALTTPKPKTRNLVRREAQALAVALKFVPDRISDALLMRYMKPG